MELSAASASVIGTPRENNSTRISGVSFRSAVESRGATSNGTPDVNTVRAAAAFDLMFHSGSGFEPGA